jgi:hypothetical protein
LLLLALALATPFLSLFRVRYPHGQEIMYVVIVQAVENDSTFAAGSHQTPLTQDAQLVRDTGAVDPGCHRQVTDAQLSSRKCRQDA